MPMGVARTALVLLLALAAGGACGYAAAGAAARERLASALDFADEGRDLRVRGVVATLPTRFEGGVHFVFDIDSVLVPGMTLPGRIALSWYGSPVPVHAAQRWEFTVRLRRPHGGANPAGFDAEAWMLEQGIRATGTVRAGPHDPAAFLLQDRVARFNPLVDRAREALRARLEASLAAARFGSVVVALVMGDQAGIAEADWTLFNRTGISHLVSISGLHITMIAAACA
jgi:competence protein ComEC